MNNKNPCKQEYTLPSNFLFSIDSVKRKNTIGGKDIFSLFTIEKEIFEDCSYHLLNDTYNYFNEDSGLRNDVIIHGLNIVPPFMIHSLFETVEEYGVFSHFILKGNKKNVVFKPMNYSEIMSFHKSFDRNNIDPSVFNKKKMLPLLTSVNLLLDRKFPYLFNGAITIDNFVFPKNSMLQSFPSSSEYNHYIEDKSNSNTMKSMDFFEKRIYSNISNSNITDKRKLSSVLANYLFLSEDLWNNYENSYDCENMDKLSFSNLMDDSMGNNFNSAIYKYSIFILANELISVFLSTGELFSLYDLTMGKSDPIEFSHVNGQYISSINNDRVQEIIINVLNRYMDGDFSVNEYTYKLMDYIFYDNKDSYDSISLRDNYVHFLNGDIDAVYLIDMLDEDVRVCYSSDGSMDNTISKIVQLDDEDGLIILDYFSTQLLDMEWLPTYYEDDYSIFVFNIVKRMEKTIGSIVLSVKDIKEIILKFKIHALKKNYYRSYPDGPKYSDEQINNYYDDLDSSPEFLFYSFLSTNLFMPVAMICVYFSIMIKANKSFAINNIDSIWNSFYDFYKVNDYQYNDSLPDHLTLSMMEFIDFFCTNNDILNQYVVGNIPLHMIMDITKVQ